MGGGGGRRGWGGEAEVESGEGSGRKRVWCSAATTAATPPRYYDRHLHRHRLAVKGQGHLGKVEPLCGRGSGGVASVRGQGAGQEQV